MFQKGSFQCGKSIQLRSLLLIRWNLFNFSALTSDIAIRFFTSIQLWIMTLWVTGKPLQHSFHEFKFAVLVKSVVQRIFPSFILIYTVYIYRQMWRNSVYTLHLILNITYMYVSATHLDVLALKEKYESRLPSINDTLM